MRRGQGSRFRGQGITANAICIARATLTSDPLNPDRSYV